MIQKITAFLIVLVMAMPLAACGGGEETTITGMVVSIDGTTISLMEMDSDNMGGRDFFGGERPEMPEGMEGMKGFGGFGNFNPEDFDGQMPEQGDFPQWEEGEMPEMPEGMTPPEGMTMPENGEMPDFGGMNGKFGNFDFEGETKTLDIGNAHISVEIDGGKASGSLTDIQPGSFVTVTVNGKGEATYVLVSASSGFGGGRMPQFDFAS